MIEIEKPLTILREDFIASIVDLCNNSCLPYFIVEDILKDVLSEVRVASQNQIASDRRKYEEKLRKLSERKVEGD